MFEDTTTAVLLAAGRGARLGALTASRPKCMLEVGGRSLIQRWLDALDDTGLASRVVVAGYRASVLGRHVAGRCQWICNDAWEARGAIASLLAARPMVTGRPFLLVNTDVLVADKIYFHPLMSILTIPFPSFLHLKHRLISPLQDLTKLLNLDQILAGNRQ